MRWSPDLVVSVFALVAVLALGAGIIFWIRGWRQRFMAGEPSQPGEDLDHFRTLFAQGKLTREELERIERLFAEPEKPDAPPPD
jgi:hypothetical protein